MAPSTSKKRGDDKKRKRGSDKGAKRFPSRLGAYAACRKLLGQIEGCRLPARDEDDPLGSIEDLLTRLDRKTAEGLTWSLLGPSLSGFWCDPQCSVMEVEATDLRHQQTVDLLVKVFAKVLEKGCGGKKKDALLLEDLTAIFEWLEDISIAVQNMSKGKQKPRSDSQLASSSDSREDAPSPSYGKSQVKKKVRIDVSVQVQANAENSEDEDQLDSEDDLLPKAPPPPKAKKQPPTSGAKVKPSSVKTGQGSSSSAKEGTTGARSERAIRRLQSREGSSGSSRPRRTPVSAQKPVQTGRRKYGEGDVLMALLPKPTSFRWPAMVLDRNLLRDEATVEGIKTEEAYLVSLLPSHERYWIAPSGLTALHKPRVPADLDASEAREFAEAVALLQDDAEDELQRWMDDELQR